MSPFVARPLFALLALAIILAAAGGQGIALPFAVAVMWLGVLRLHLRGSHWQGAAMLVLVWLVFPLLKTVNAKRKLDNVACGRPADMGGQRAVGRAHPACLPAL